MATSNLRFRIIGDDDASPAFLKVAASAALTKKSFDNLGQSTFQLTRMVGGAGLIPVAAAASAVLAELTTSAASGAGALGIFGLSVFGIAKDMKASQEGIATVQKKLDGLSKGTKEYKTTLNELHAKQASFNKQFGPAAKGFLDMKVAFDQFQTATRGVTTSVMAKGFKLVADVLPRLAPISNAAGKAVGGLIDELSGWTKSNAFAGLLEWFRTSGPKAITHFGHAVGNTLEGLGGILKNFVGPGDKAAASLDRLTQRFAEWGNSKGVSASVDGFLKYVSDNGPMISSVFASLADVLPKMAEALGKLGSFNLTAISMFLELVAKLPQGVFDTLAVGMFAFAAASKLISIWTAAAAVGQLALNVAMAANPVLLVVVALAALAAGLIYAYKHSETFRNIVNGAFNAVKKVVGVVVGFIKDHWEMLLVLLTGGTGLAVVAIVKNFDKVVGAIKVLGQWGKWLWNSVFQPVLKFIVEAIGKVISVWAGMLHALSHVPGFGWVGKIADGLDHAADKASALAGKINDIPSTKSVDVVINVIKGVVHSTGGHVPAMADGGIVRRPTLALIGEAGPEAVVPLSRAKGFGGAGGGVIITVNASGLVDAPSYG
jgi:hypothetical protein